MDPRTTLAARNNALWCDVMCRANGGDTELNDALWVNNVRSPRLYPNVVSVAPDPRPVRAAVERLLKADLGADWGVKDSYATADVSSLGFDEMFEATWLHRPAREEDPDDTVQPITHIEELEAWEKAWTDEPGADAIFSPALLADKDVRLLALRDAADIVAGVATYRSDDVVGLTNIFGVHRHYATLLRAAGAAWPGLDLVGYESGDALADAEAEGFAPIGRLRVWTKR